MFLLKNTLILIYGFIYLCSIDLQARLNSEIHWKKNIYIATFLWLYISIMFLLVLYIYSFFLFLILPPLSFFLPLFYLHSYTSASRVTIDSIELFKESAELSKSCCMRIIKDPWPGWCVEEYKVTKERPRYVYNTFTCPLIRSL